MERVTIRGRGAGSNPPNRFERLAFEPDPEWASGEEAEAWKRTQYFRDTSRRILARNESPDVGFDVSINPYRGCMHGCVYCLSPDTPVLCADLGWRPLGDVRIGDELAAFDEYPEPGRRRKFRKAVVERIWRWKRPTVRLITRHSEVVTTANHRWLQAGQYRWSRTDRLSRGRELRRMPIVESGAEDGDYKAGYIAGISLGDATFRYEPGRGSDKLGFPRSYWRLALADEAALHRVAAYLHAFGLDLELRSFDGGSAARRPLKKLETRSLEKLGTLHTLLTTERPTRSYCRGFVAGFFDAEGHSGSSLRMSQVDHAVLGRVEAYAAVFGFRFRLEPRESCASALRLVGDLTERLRFLSVFGPAIRRKSDALFGRQLTLRSDPVLAVEPGPVQDVVDIQTSTRTFYAAGLATHNCYARPTHEYLGFSAGLDFESKILVKEDAPELLRRELSSRRWRPQPIAMSGVTDPYQPVERKLKLTRRCLEVLAEFRNPVGMVTKNHLVTRDADLLGELAVHDAAAVSVSITTLDEKLQRVMEPRTSIPARRLAAVEKLAEAGIPVGVMVAPVVPGLTDHELPSIVEAAANAGASRAGYIILRLPYGVSELFEDWLERHFPERKAKVLNRIRELRGGRLNEGAFHARMKGAGIFAEQVRSMFQVACRKAGLDQDRFRLSTAAFRRPAAGGQLGLFEDA